MCGLDFPEHTLQKTNPKLISQGIEAFVSRTGADEVIIAGHIFDHDARVRSIQIVAEQMMLATALSS